MQFDESTEGRYRIHTVSLEAHQGDGYIAALVVERAKRQSRRGPEAYRDESLACGFRWQSPVGALRYAVDRARELISKQPRNASQLPALGASMLNAMRFTGRAGALLGFSPVLCLAVLSYVLLIVFPQEPNANPRSSATPRALGAAASGSSASARPVAHRT